MDRPTYLTKLASIEQELPKLANTLNAMKITDTVSYGKIYEELSLDAAQRAEKITCSLRSLIFAANLVSKPMLLKKAASKESPLHTLVGSFRSRFRGSCQRKPSILIRRT